MALAFKGYHWDIYLYQRHLPFISSTLLSSMLTGIEWFISYFPGGLQELWENSAVDVKTAGHEKWYELYVPYMIRLCALVNIQLIVSCSQAYAIFGHANNEEKAIKSWVGSGN